MRGSRVSAATEQEFRKHYLVTGNASAAARAAKLPVSTGTDLAHRAHKDPAFVRARQEIRARLLPDAEQMATAAMQICLERLNNDPPDIVKLAGLGVAKVSFQDPGPQYAASLAKLHQTIVGGRRYESEKMGEIPTERDVRITVQGPDAAARKAG